MKPDQKSLRLGAAAIICAVLLRLIAAVLPGNMVQALSDTTPAMIFLETGRTAVPTEKVPVETLIHIPTAPAPETPVFSPEDAALLQFNNTTTHTPDPEALLRQPLPACTKVLILHTHTCESYEGSATETGYRSTDPQKNMTCVGQALTAALERSGIQVIHDQTVHDQLSYNGSYASAKETIQQHLSRDPQISLVLDLHRDAIQTSDGSQKAVAVPVGDRQAAQLMLVVGGGNSYQPQPNWQDNLALAAKLQLALEQLAPGITRPICLRPYCYNQDLSPGALIVEVGAAGNTMEEALLSAQLLAEAITSLSKGQP